jgi:hypothetical protein
MTSHRILLLLVALAAPATTCAWAQLTEVVNGDGQSAALIPDFAGQWGRDMLFYEPPPSGPGPLINSIRKADGTATPKNPCCTIVAQGGWLGNHASPILKPEAAAAVDKFGAAVLRGVVMPDLHNSCWPEPPPYVMSLQFGLNIVQRKDEVTLLYLLYNTVRHVHLNEPHPESVAPSWQGHSVGRYEGDTLVIDTVGIKAAPLSTVDPFGTPHSEALHVVERYRLIDGRAAVEAQQQNGAINRPVPPYGRGPIDPDTGKKGLQVAFTGDDPGVFTTPWSGLVTYRRLIGTWPESVCAVDAVGAATSVPRNCGCSPDF